jgi:thiamine kinase-like enzyme
MSGGRLVKVDEIVARIPGWEREDVKKVKVIGGLTNTSYLVEVNDVKYVLRISGDNTDYLGINRESEFEALQVAAANGLGPEVVHFIQPEGHSVTRYIPGCHWTYEEYCQKPNLKRMVAAVKRIHCLPAIKAESSPFRRIESYLPYINKFEIPYPEGFTAAMDRMRAIEAEINGDPFKYRGFCHNDLFSLNFIDDGRLWFLDWEFAGMGDIFYDLATLAYSFDSIGEIPAELQEYILECYFGSVDKTHRILFTQMKFMVLFYAVMWGLLQYGLQRSGIVPSVDGFDCLQYANFMFATIRESNFL